MNIQDAAELLHNYMKRNPVHTDELELAFEVLLQHAKQPTLPKEPTDEMINDMKEACAKYYKTSSEHFNTLGDAIREEYAALYNRLTIPPKPKTKKIKVWRVEYVIDMQPYSTHPYIKPEDAERFVKCCGYHMTCINIIESEQEVPA